MKGKRLVGIKSSFFMNKVEKRVGILFLLLIMMFTEINFDGFTQEAKADIAKTRNVIL